LPVLEIRKSFKNGPCAARRNAGVRKHNAVTGAQTTLRRATWKVSRIHLLASGRVRETGDPVIMLSLCWIALSLVTMLSFADYVARQTASPTI
jgi:hypothetical protein